MNRHIKALESLSKGGFIPAIPLALDKNRCFDPNTQRTLIRYYLDSGVDGVATAVHSTQFEIRDPKINLFEPVLKLAKEEIDKYEKETGRTIIRIAGVCGNNEQAIKEATLALKYGYDAVLLSPGGLNHLSEDEMLTRTKLIAQLIPVIGFYLQTSVGGRKFSYNYWEKLCEIENLVAIKCASFNRYTTLDVIRAAALSTRSNNITLYTGNDDNIVVDLLTKYKFENNGKIYEKAFEGGLLGHWCVWTSKAVKLFREIKEVKNQEILSAKWLTLAAQITDINSAFFDTSNNFKGCIPGLHEVLRRQGIFQNILCLDEEEALSSGQNEEINRVYSMYPDLNDDEFVKNNLRKWKNFNEISS